MRKSLFIILFFLVFSFSTFAQNKPTLPEIERVRIAEAFRVGEKLQNKIWKNWNQAPFALLLVTDENEFLIRHPKPSDEFQSIGYDKSLKSEIFVRPRKFQKFFLATFSAFDKTPVIIVGTAENTLAKTSTAWIFTVLHEHFHQLQMSQPTYFADVEKLNLSRGDQTGMWQLNFPFPYADKEIGDKFKSLSGFLLDAYNSPKKSERNKKIETYQTERRRFAEMLKADDYKYFSFQLWQEGIANYTQYKMAELAARKMKPSKEFENLKDFTPFAKEAENILAKANSNLKNINLAESERVVFYPFGTFEGLLLDKSNPKWRDEYFVDKFALESFYKEKIK